MKTKKITDKEIIDLLKNSATVKEVGLTIGMSETAIMYRMRKIRKKIKLKNGKIINKINENYIDNDLLECAKKCKSLKELAKMLNQSVYNIILRSYRVKNDVKLVNGRIINMRY